MNVALLNYLWLTIYHKESLESQRSSRGTSRQNSLDIAYDPLSVGQLCYPAVNN